VSNETLSQCSRYDLASTGEWDAYKFRSFDAAISERDRLLSLGRYRGQREFRIDVKLAVVDQVEDGSLSKWRILGRRSHLAIRRHGRHQIHRQRRERPLFSQHHSLNLLFQWDLVCERLPLLSTVQGSYMGGVFVGCIVFGWASDRYGRRTTMLVAAAIQAWNVGFTSP